MPDQENEAKKPLIDILIAVAKRGGVENVVNITAKYLSGHGFRVRILQEVYEGDAWADPSIEFHYFFSSRKGMDSDKLVDGYYEFLKDNEKPDLVLATAWPMMSYAAAAALQKTGAQCPVASWLHAPLKRYVDAGYGDERHLKCADVHFAISEEIKRELLSGAENAVIYRVNNPVVFPQEVASREKRLRKKLLYVGRFSIEKDPITILKALMKAPDDWKVDLVGVAENKEYEKALLSAAEVPAITKRVTFCGWQSDPWKYSEDVDFLVISSFYEGFSLSAVEALSRGIPVIATPVGVIPELIKPGENGFIFPSGDADALAEIITYIDKGILDLPDPKRCIESAGPYRAEAALFDFSVKISATAEGKIIPDVFYIEKNADKS